MPGRDGPHNYWSEDALPSRGQWKTIAELALELLDEQQPRTRLAASLQIGALRHALEQPSPPSTARPSSTSSTSDGDERTAAEQHGSNGTSVSGAHSAARAASSSSGRSRTGARTVATTPSEGG